MGLACARTTDQDHVVRGLRETPARELVDQLLVDHRRIEVEAGQIPVHGEARRVSSCAGPNASNGLWSPPAASAQPASERHSQDSTLLATAAFRPNPQRYQSNTINQVLSYLGEHLAESLFESDLARYAGMEASAHHWCRIRDWSGVRSRDAEHDGIPAGPRQRLQHAAGHSWPSGKLDTFHTNAGAYIGGDVATGDPDAGDRMLNLNSQVTAMPVSRLMDKRGSAWTYGQGFALTTCPHLRPRLTTETLPST